MSRDATAKAQDTYKQSKALTADSKNKTNDLYGKLTPFYSGEMTNPEGLGDESVAKMNTAAQEAAGGAVSSAVGAGNLMAARDRNSGGFAPALDESVRNAMKSNSDAALGVQNEDALLKEQQKQEGAAGLHNLYGTENNDVLSSLGLQNQSTNTEIEAGKSGWFQNMTGLLNSIKGAGAKGVTL
jgi:hypothetical protein